MTITREQLTNDIMERLGTDASEQDAQRLYDYLRAHDLIRYDDYRGLELVDAIADDDNGLVHAFAAMQREAIGYDAQTGYYTLPALGGEDVTRERTSILVEIGADGVARNPAHYDEPWVIVGRSTLRGWGELDGDTYTLSCGGAWAVDVPVSIWLTLPIDSEI